MPEPVPELVPPWAVPWLCPLPAVSDGAQSWVLLQGFAGDLRVLLFFKPLKIHNLSRKSCSSPSLGESHFFRICGISWFVFLYLLGYFFKHCC